ncbi:MAG: OpgC domain-containing protein [Rhizobiaceae bacterium]
MTATATKRTVRDPRLDFFRGLAMFVIFIAHTPRDFWALWIPARFGFSDATETFVFCSGMASAIAFGAIFHKHGWLMGSARIVYRVWQVYWAHIGLFFAVLLLITSFDQAGIFTSEYWSRSYVGALNLKHFFTKTPDLIIGLFTLTYVPNYFDILPMYLVILAMIPIVMGLSRISLWAVASFVIGVWLLANLELFGAEPINFPAEPWSQRNWFFNPLGWQLVFFTGFAFMSGWIKPPPVDKRLIILAVVIILVSLPFAYFRIYNAKPSWVLYTELSPWFKEQRAAIAPLRGKSEFGLFRYIHFLATAYLAWVAVGPLGSRLKNWGRAQIVVDTIRKVGQQSLAVFVSSLVIAQIVGMGFRMFSTHWAVVLTGNLIGFAALIAVAHSAAWFKSQPWRQQKVTPPATSASQSGSSTVPMGVPARKID